MKTDLAIVKKNLSDLRVDSHQDSKFKIEFKKSDGSLFSVNNLNIPKWLPEGEYALTAYCLDTDEPVIILENEILIESKKDIEAPIQQNSKNNDPPDDFVLKLRKQDQESWERERILINKYWETEVARIRGEHNAEKKAIIDKHDFEMNLMKKNGDVLESEREKIRESLAKELRIEKKYDNSVKKRGFGERLLDMVDSNPDLLIAVLDKFKLVDPETVDALKNMNEAAGVKE